MKTKLFSLLLAVAASVGTMFASTKIGDLYYNLNATDQTAKVTYELRNENNYKGLTTANIPASVTYNSVTYSITSIGDYAFRYCSGLTSVTIGNSVTSIGNYAFDGCSSLTKVNITDIAAWCNIAFGGSSANPLHKAKHLFVNDIEVTELVIPDGVTSVGQYAFYDCSSLTSVTIPNSVTSIGEFAFNGCSSFTSVTIPNSVTSIGEYAFNGCSSLTSVTIPNSVTSIGDGAFSYCSNLTSITIPNSVTSFGQLAIRRCEKLTSITAPAGIYDAPEDYLPYYPKHLENVCVNAGELTEDAFGFIARSYKTLKSLDLSATTHTELADEAFKDFYNLQSLKLPANLTRINYMAVAGCKNLLNIDIPATVEEIEQSAFEDCRSMSSVTFAGNALTSIGSWAFYNCHALQNVVIPEGVTEIGDGAFYGCTYLADVYIPASARIIGDNAFALCSKMAQLTVNAVEPPVIASKTFDEVSREMPVYVPNASVAAYKSDPLWGQMNIIGCVTAVEAVGIAPAATKFIRDNQVLILRDGKTYTIQGVEVK